MSKHLILCEAPEPLLKHVSSKEFIVGIKNEVDSDEIELGIFGPIGKTMWDDTGTGASDVAKLLKDNKGKKVNVKINSPGGLAYDGITIYNSLVEHDGEVTTTVMCMAGSAAAIISQAGSTRKIYANGSFFIHRALGFAYGNIDVMNDVAEFLDKLDGQIAETFAARTGLNKKAVMEAMRGKLDGTTYSSGEAVKEGYFDEIVSVVPKGAKKKKTSNEAEDPTAEALEKQAEEEAAAREAEAISVRLRMLNLDDSKYAHVVNSTSGH